MSRLFFAPALLHSVSVGCATPPSFSLAETKNFSAHQCVYSFVQYYALHRSSSPRKICGFFGGRDGTVGKIRSVKSRESFRGIPVFRVAAMHLLSFQSLLVLKGEATEGMNHRFHAAGGIGYIRHPGFLAVSPMRRHSAEKRPQSIRKNPKIP